MVINHLEKLFVTSDAATILREMDIMHPAAKMMVMAAQQQEREVRSCCPPWFSLSFPSALLPHCACM